MRSKCTTTPCGADSGCSSSTTCSPPGARRVRRQSSCVGWAATSAALRYEPIITVYLHAPGRRLIAPMTALPEGPRAPAQFAFDHGALGATPGRFAFVISGAREWVERGLDATGQAVLEQARTVLPLSLMTQFIWTGSLLAFINLFNQRTAPDAQAETQDVARLMLKAVIDSGKFTHSLKAHGYE